MPRKGFSNFDDYDDGFDDDDAYDYDYDEEDEHEAAEPKEEICQQGLWQCAICTYDNDESMHVCDICGVIRHPVPGGNQTINKNQVEGRSNEFKVSKLAKSLFESVPSNTKKKAVVYLPEHKNPVMEKGPFSGISRGNIHDLHKAFSSKSSCASIGECEGIRCGIFQHDVVKNEGSCEINNFETIVFGLLFLYKTGRTEVKDDDNVDQSCVSEVLRKRAKTTRFIIEPMLAAYFGSAIMDCSTSIHTM